MRYEIQCNVCSARCWTRGVYESDTDAVVLDDNDPLEDGCEHMRDGGDFTIIDEEAYFDEE